MCAAQTLTAPQRVALTAWQSHRQSQWHPSSLSLSPGRMICLSIHADTSKFHDIHADTAKIHTDTNSLNRYRSDTIWYIQIHEILYAVYITFHIPVCVMYLHVWCMYSTSKKGHTYNIQAHISIHICMYEYVFACMWDIFCVCMCMYEDVCCAYYLSLCYIACMCLYFLQANLLVGRYAQHTDNMHTYIQI